MYCVLHIMYFFLHLFAAKCSHLFDETIEEYEF